MQVSRLVLAWATASDMLATAFRLAMPAIPLPLKRSSMLYLKGFHQALTSFFFNHLAQNTMPRRTTEAALMTESYVDKRNPCCTCGNASSRSRKK